MALHAIDDVTDALSATATFLRGLDRRDWLPLAALALLTGGAGNTALSGSGSAGTGTPTGATAPDAVVPGGLGTVPDGLGTVPGWAWLLLAGVLVLAVAILVVDSVLQFAFVDALRTGDVALRRGLADHWGRGLRLLGFRVAVAAVVAALFAAAVLPVVLGLRFGALALLLLPVAAFAALLAGLVTGFTRAFVVPVMLVADVGVLAGWRRFWAPLRANPGEYAAFAVANLVLVLVLGAATAVASALVALAVLAPAALVFGVPFALAGASGALAWAWLGVGVLLSLVALLLGVGLVSAPAQVALRYYALFVLGDTDPALDPIPDRRAAVRGGDDAAAA